MDELKMLNEKKENSEFMEINNNNTIFHLNKKNDINGYTNEKFTLKQESLNKDENNDYMYTKCV